MLKVNGSKNQKRVLILTLKQGANYGGMLQAYALQKTLINQGYYVETTWSKGSFVRRLFKSVPGLRLLINIVRGTKMQTDQKVTMYTSSFVDRYVKLIDFDMAFMNAKFGRYGAYVVGSDQVWRKPFTHIPHNLINFEKVGAVKISYAASFGKDNLNEYGDKLIARTRQLAQRFNAISVREDSGVGIVKQYWGLDAECHVDPTLLIGAVEYLDLINNPSSELYTPDGNLFSYVLDADKAKRSIADMIAKKCDLKVFTVIDGDENNGKPMPPVEQWLRSFRDAKYVVTDSFHGTVFSIIFNKPFIAIGNKERGLARFTSLLKLFGLEDRLVTSADEVTEELINKEIDWDKVNAIKKREQKRSFDYLKKHLGDVEVDK